MQASEFLPKLGETLNARRVYSEPLEHDGITVITAAQIRGGGGLNQDPQHTDGGGMGFGARPVGAYVIGNGKVKWKPALDLSRIIFRGQVLAFTALVVAGWLLGRRGSQ